MQVESIQESISLSLIDGEESHGRDDEYDSKSKQPMVQYQSCIHGGVGLLDMTRSTT